MTGNLSVQFPRGPAEDAPPDRVLGLFDRIEVAVDGRGRGGGRERAMPAGLRHWAAAVAARMFSDRVPEGEPG
jgi:hypothetical protein